MLFAFACLLPISKLQDTEAALASVSKEDKKTTQSPWFLNPKDSMAV